MIFALELVKSMAIWYPKDYINKHLNSIFKDQYDELLDKRVVFPEEKEFKYVKNKDKEKFIKNF